MVLSPLLGSAAASTLPEPVRVIAIVVLLLATCVWVGGWAAVIVVARSTTATLTREARVAFFRHFGRLYGVVSTIALVVAIVAGGILLLTREWTGLATAIAVVTLILVLTLGWGVVQARSLSRMRAELHESEDAALAQRIERRAASATVLRGMIGVLSIVVLVLGIIVAV